ncbi:MAG: hypothetical protein KAJ10_14835, partial [Thermodesulfovibrionia bacterium]|nr:hypothetical protein [Thermodesulfovibrionia bacterium]
MGKDVLLMICYARSGGTLLNQCLGSLPDTVVLSEVNPLSGGVGAPIKAESPYEQALRWYGIPLKSRDFSGSILELMEICRQKSLSLIVRDWSFVNFMPMSRNNYQAPYKFLTLESLKSKCNMAVFAFVRNAIDVFLSRGEEINSFSTNYLRYVKAVVNLKVPVFKYEDFCRSPETILKSMCALGGINFSESFWNFSSFLNVNGDSQDRGKSRGGKHNKIIVLPRKRVSAQKAYCINNNEEIKEANKL